MKIRVLSLQVKVKVIFALEEATKTQGGEKSYSSALSLTTALDGVGGQRHAPAALPPEKTRYSLYRRLGGPQGRSGRVRIISPPTGIRFPDRPTCSESLYRLSHPGAPAFLVLPGIEPRSGCDIFRTSTDRSWGLPNFLYMGYQVIPRRRAAVA